MDDREAEAPSVSVFVRLSGPLGLGLILDGIDTLDEFDDLVRNQDARVMFLRAHSYKHPEDEYRVNLREIVYAGRGGPE